MYAYDIKTDTWISAPALPTVWRHLCLASVDKKIYAFGGSQNKIAVLEAGAENWTSQEDNTLSEFIKRYYDVYHDKVYILCGGWTKSTISHLYGGEITEHADKFSIDDGSSISDCAILTLKQ